MKVNSIRVVEPDGTDLSLAKRGQGRLFIRTYLPTFFQVTLDGQVDLAIPVHSVEYDPAFEPDGMVDAIEVDQRKLDSLLAPPDMFGDVGRFHEKFSLTTFGSDPPSNLVSDVAEFRFNFMREELHEFGDAVTAGDLPKAADALADLVYVALGTAHLMGIPFDAIWAEVQRANMQKERAVSADDPRSTRKHALDVVKPEGWRAPDHEPALRAAGWLK